MCKPLEEFFEGYNTSSHWVQIYCKSVIAKDAI